MELIFIIFTFSFVGVGLEVFWTSIARYVKTRNTRLVGESYLWISLFIPLSPLFIF